MCLRLVSHFLLQLSSPSGRQKNHISSKAHSILFRHSLIPPRMPKVVTSSCRRLRAQHHPPASTAPIRHSPVLAAAPRKVSFEDGHQSSSSFTSTSSSSSAQPTGSTSCSSIASSLSSSKSSLRRKAPSVCLVGLASGQDEPQEQSHHHCLSPTPSSSEANSTAPSSPWGHFVDILVPLDEEEERCHTKRRLLGDASPLFGYVEPESRNSWIPSLVGPKKHKHRRRWGAPHPYALQPRQHRRRQNKPSFLPGFFLEGDRTSESSETRDVEQALQRLQV